MSLKVHFLHSHSDFFPENLGEVSDGQGESLHQDIKLMERLCQGFWNDSVVAEADYWWLLHCDAPDLLYHRKIKLSHF
jgi:hypothetical protein